MLVMQTRRQKATPSCSILKLVLFFMSYSSVVVDRHGSVGIATGYGLDCPGILSRGVLRFSAPVQTGQLYQGYRVFP